MRLILLFGAGLVAGAVVFQFGWSAAMLSVRRRYPVLEYDSVRDLLSQSNRTLRQAARASRRGQSGLAEELMEHHRLLVREIEKENEER